MNKRRKDTPRLLRPLHLVVPDPRRLHPTHNQCTLKPEEPLNGGISKDFSQNFTPNHFQIGRLGRFGVKSRLFRG
ncbi:transposase [Corynebacterium diphtheriae]|nr:transposase [Corynebacterium diphtheriae]CAB0873010.1 transposase [Corynebacterium diphtheriae]CAB0888805.1 transposase [Corynebacterium diphtheriae]CAB0916049.1 transposase [Corynebacterium diphtheriae]CAB0968921.1 transposase [Corynebacterium diphtheriae]